MEVWGKRDSGINTGPSQSRGLPALVYSHYPLVPRTRNCAKHDLRAPLSLSALEIGQETAGTSPEESKTEKGGRRVGPL
uniref:Uncharacterized protein n=1 Tax=Mycena chlorophos TaxID=658473 RepID=A0ABQ0LDF8_MYCCL|nr:predicted protein [Mycena chlorophos]